MHAPSTSGTGGWGAPGSCPDGRLTRPQRAAINRLARNGCRSLGLTRNRAASYRLPGKSGPLRLLDPRHNLRPGWNHRARRWLRRQRTQSGPSGRGTLRSSRRWRNGRGRLWRRWARSRRRFRNSRNRRSRLRRDYRRNLPGGSQDLPRTRSSRGSFRSRFRTGRDHGRRRQRYGGGLRRRRRRRLSYRCAWSKWRGDSRRLGAHGTRLLQWRMNRTSGG